MYKADTNDTVITIGSGGNIGFFDCVLAGTTEIGAGNERTSHTVSEGYTFGYVVSGKGTAESEGTVLPLPADTFYFIGKGQKVTFSGEKTEEQPWKMLWIQTDGILTDDMIRTFRLGELFASAVNVRHPFLEIHDKLSRMKTGDHTAVMQKISCLLFEILTEVRREYFAPSDRRSEGTAEAIRSYLDSNLYNDISLDLLTEEFGISKMHVIRLFKKEFDTTPMQYVMDRRISLAKSLLSGTVMPVKEIADLLRYANSQHFSNAFRTAVGVSPNQYRKTMQTE